MLFNVAAKQLISILNHLVRVEAVGTRALPRSGSRSRMWNLLSVVSTIAVSSVVTLLAVKYIERKKEGMKEEVVKGEISEYEEAQLKLSVRKPERIWNTVLFFEGGVTHDPELATLKGFMYYLESARATIQLCVYRLSHSILGDLILRKFDSRRGLLVQIITDYDVFMSTDKGTTRLLKRCFEQGISLKVRKAKSHMHHKFVIIDGEAVLMGSLNWTEQAFTSNHEDVLVTTNPLHVKKYLQRFQTLWKQAQDPGDLINK